MPSQESPSQNGTFLVVALESGYFSSAFVQAAGLVFRIGGGAPETYCPDFVAQSVGCPPGQETVWTCASGFCDLVCCSDFLLSHLTINPQFLAFANSCQTVEVPGGQQIYVAPNGAVGYTQAHSGVAPPGSQFEGFAVENGELSFATSGFYACVSADNSTYPQLYASALMSNYDNCYSIKLATATGNEPGFAAWQYT